MFEPSMSESETTASKPTNAVEILFEPYLTSETSRRHWQVVATQSKFGGGMDDHRFEISRKRIQIRAET